MSATSNAITETDVIFGLRDSKNDDKNNLATKRLDDIVKENVQAHREAGREGRRKIEWSIIKQLQKELPSGSRFVKFCHSSEQGSNYFHMMTDQEARQAIAGMYSHLHSCHASSEPGAIEMYSNSSTAASNIQERATNDDVESGNSCHSKVRFNHLNDSDVVFGKGGKCPTAGTERFREIVKENVEAHGNVDDKERRRIEEAVIAQVKKVLPADARFLRYFPMQYDVPGKGTENEFYSVMTDDEISEAVKKVFIPQRKLVAQKAKSTLQQLHDPASQHSMTTCNVGDVVFGKAGLSNQVVTGTLKLRKIVKENFEAYRDAGRKERRNIEQAVITQVKTVLPPDARFLRYFPGKGTQEEFYTLVTSSELPKEVKKMFNNKLTYVTTQEKIATVRARIRQPQVPAQRYANGNIPHHPIQEGNSIGVELNDFNDSADQRPSKQLNVASTSQEKPPAETKNEHSDPTSNIYSTATKRSNEGSHAASNKKARVASLQTTDSSEPTMIMIKQDPVERNDEDLDVANEPPSDPQFDLSGIIIKEEPVDQNEELATLMNIKSNLEAMCERFQSKDAKLKRKIAGLQQNRIPASELERLQIENAELKQKIAVFKQKIAELEKELGVAGAGLEESLREYCIAES